MKKFKVLLAAFMCFAMVFLTMQCQHDDEEIIPVVGPDPIEHGVEIITCTACNVVPPGAGVLVS